MELEIIKDEKNVLEFIIKGERHTFPNLLRECLTKDSNVAFASYRLEHPFDKDARFIVRTKENAQPKKILLSACDSIESDLKELGKSLKKAAK